MVTELRLSIFDLRSGVSTNAGLGSVLADYVREVGKGSGMAVHVSLEESPDGCASTSRPSCSASRQEAVTNARKHSKATNLWVTCRVEPPFAEIRIEDDGVGYAGPREDHYGLHIMNERADRINAVLTIGEPSRWRHRCLRSPAPRRSPLATPSIWRKPCPTPCCSSMTTT